MIRATRIIAIDVDKNPTRLRDEFAGIYSLVEMILSHFTFRVTAEPPCSFIEPQNDKDLRWALP